jgi:Uma2 family endonuclease
MSVVAPNLSTRSRIPSLQQGDRLSRQEFHRRYVASPHIKKAELIEGIVHMASPVSCQHASPHAQLNTILGMYSGRTPGVEVLDNATVRLDDYNEVQPDILLRVAGSRKDGGAGNTYVEGAPELVVEIAASSVNVDLHDKLEAYRRNGVMGSIPSSTPPPASFTARYFPGCG